MTPSYKIDSNESCSKPYNKHTMTYLEYMILLSNDITTHIMITEIKIGHAMILSSISTSLMVSLYFSWL